MNCVDVDVFVLSVLVDGYALIFPVHNYIELVLLLLINDILFERLEVWSESHPV